MQDLALAENLIYCANGSDGLAIVDVSDPGSPVLVGSVDTPGTAVSVSVSGNIACVADWTGGLQIIDVSNPAFPSIIGNAAIPNAAGVAVDGDIAYAGAAYGGDYSLKVLNIANPN